MKCAKLFIFSLSKNIDKREKHASYFFYLKCKKEHITAMPIIECNTIFCIQLFSARNSFTHISRSMSGTFTATQLPYAFAY